jgi:hypothetical protein
LVFPFEVFQSTSGFDPASGKWQVESFVNSFPVIGRYVTETFKTGKEFTEYTEMRAKLNGNKNISEEEAIKMQLSQKEAVWSMVHLVNMLAPMAFIQPISPTLKFFTGAEKSAIPTKKAKITIAEGVLEKLDEKKVNDYIEYLNLNVSSGSITKDMAIDFLTALNKKQEIYYKDEAKLDELFSVKKIINKEE